MGFADVLQGVGQIQNIQSSDSHFQGTSFWKCRVRAAPIAEIHKRSLKQKAAPLYYNICEDTMSVRIKGCCKMSCQVAKSHEVAVNPSPEGFANGASEQ